MGTPTVPEKLDHGDDDRDADPGNRAEQRDAGEARHRQLWHRLAGGPASEKSLADYVMGTAAPRGGDRRRKVLM
jgi:hypothetical protein